MTKYWLATCKDGFEIGIKADDIDPGAQVEDLHLSCPLHSNEQLTFTEVDAQRYAQWEAEQEAQDG